MAVKDKGIDISTFQKNVVFSKVKKDGIKFAILRAGFGRYTSQKDAMFESHYKNAKAAGMPVGAYWYSYAKSVDQAKQEAETCAKVLAGKQFEYPIFFDIEESSQAKLGKKVCTEMCEAFCDTMEEKGYYVGVYANKNWFTNYLDYDALSKKYQIWIAQYNNSMTFGKEVQMWQYSSSGSVDGASGRIDMNWCYVDYPSIIKSGGFNGFEKSGETKPDSDSKPASKKVDVTYCVQANGRWLPEVKNLEDYAGNDNQAITAFMVKVSKGKVRYRAHLADENRWLNWITGYNKNDFKNGYAGNGKGHPIDGIQVYFETPDDIRPHQQAYYRVSEVGRSGYLHWIEDTSTKNGSDGYAGNLNGKAIDRIQIQVKERD